MVCPYDIHVHHSQVQPTHILPGGSPNHSSNHKGAHLGLNRHEARTHTYQSLDVALRDTGLQDTTDITYDPWLTPGKNRAQVKKLFKL